MKQDPEGNFWKWIENYHKEADGDAKECAGLLKCLIENCVKNYTEIKGTEELFKKFEELIQSITDYILKYGWIVIAGYESEYHNEVYNKAEGVQDFLNELNNKWQAEEKFKPTQQAEPNQIILGFTTKDVRMKIQKMKNNYLRKIQWSKNKRQICLEQTALSLL